MPKFLKLTRVREKIESMDFVNFDLVFDFYRVGDLTWVVKDDNKFVLVKEMPEQIMEMLEEK